MLEIAGEGEQKARRLAEDMRTWRRMWPGAGMMRERTREMPCGKRRDLGPHSMQCACADLARTSAPMSIHRSDSDCGQKEAERSELTSKN